MISVQNVTYLVHDQDEALVFFENALGFVVVQDVTSPDGATRRLVVGPPGGGVGFVLALAPDGSPCGWQAGEDVAFFLATDDFVAEHARMVAAGVHFREEPRHEPYGTVAIFEDFYGAPWDLIEPPRPDSRGPQG